ncbi:MAG TPA: hypothetical protein VMV46_09350 [Thermoanaerobaculia bacterium]|nr:hypothetical protein [Thermoanaerobaculia bacterium]
MNGEGRDPLAELPAHPQGTLAILLIYAALWVVGWGLLFGWLFLGRGAPTG